MSTHIHIHTGKKGKTKDSEHEGQEHKELIRQAEMIAAEAKSLIGRVKSTNPKSSLPGYKQLEERIARLYEQFRKIDF